tara:strand:+ start:705 stop:1076 length:372 start_codon:yes stop_codon:yes gene_type:complete
MELTALGHKNVLATHKTTLEFTKDDYLTKKGDCILAINLDKIPKAMQGKIKIILKINNLTEEIKAEANPDFNHKTEMVIRISDFKDNRTYATRANKASKDINKNIIKLLKNPKNKLKIQLASL